MKKYRVTLTVDEQLELKEMISKGKYKNTRLKRAQILLGADESEGGKKMKDEQISLAYDVGLRTIERTRQRLVEDGLEIALHGKPRPVNVPIKMDGDLESHLIAMACSEAPEGYERWTMKLLTEGLIKKGYVAQISEETVRLTLKKTKPSPGARSTLS